MSISLTPLKEPRTRTPSVQALVSIYVEPTLVDHVAETLSRLEGIEELYESTGEFELISLINTQGIEEFRDVLKNKIMKVKGVVSTSTSIVERIGELLEC